MYWILFSDGVEFYAETMHKAYLRAEHHRKAEGYAGHGLPGYGIAREDKPSSGWIYQRMNGSLTPMKAINMTTRLRRALGCRFSDKGFKNFEDTYISGIWYLAKAGMFQKMAGCRNSRYWELQEIFSKYLGREVDFETLAGFEMK